MPEPPKEQPSEPPNTPPPEEQSESGSGEAESTDAVHLDGLNMESTAEGSDGPAFKTGKGIRHGKVTDKYVEPDRMDEVETGSGDGDGRGSSDTPAGTGGDGGDREASVKKRTRVDPDDYPVRAKRRGVEGEVVALLTVDPSGQVVDVEIKQSIGYGLDELAKEAFRKWNFEPALENGEPVRTTVRATHEFRL
ncbi:MAG: energy transducer TonB, partial [Bradymonadaceae bacterium]